MHVSVLGASGYAGGELIRLLLGHPDLSISRLYSEEFAGRRASESHRALPDDDLVFSSMDALSSDPADLFFLAVSAGRAQALAPGLLSGGKKVIDLSGGHRLAAADYPDWYGLTPKGYAGPAVYGLTEWNRAAIGAASLIANPGCYASAVLLAALPFASRGLIEGPLRAFAISGISGAGRTAGERALYCSVAENFSTYKPATHQHVPEIERALWELGETRATCQMVPHLAPAMRGIFATCTFTPKSPLERPEEVLAETYGAEPFITVRMAPEAPMTGPLSGTNRVEVSACFEPRTGTVIVQAALDNLGKGAAGQAIQNANLMFSLPETRGLLPGAEKKVASS